MNHILVLAILFLPWLATASSYYCNGNTKQSGSSWYYPNGNTAQSGSSVYYSNGNTLKSGSSLYYRNGNTLKSGSSLYYNNGNTLQSGSSFYHSNGNTMKSGSSCYDANGNSLGDCPRSYNLSLSGETSMEAILNLAEGVVTSFIHTSPSNGRPTTLVLDGEGDIIDIRYDCSNDLDPAVESILSQYHSLGAQNKAKVRDQICGP